MTAPHPRHREFAGADGDPLIGDAYGHSARGALLLHGGGQTRHAWRATARRLAERGFTAFPMDQRGHGDSPWIESGAYTFRDYGRDAVALGQAIGAEMGSKPVAIGASLGGIAALWAQGMAACYSALILVDITPRMEAAGVAHVQNFMAARARDGFASIDEAADSVAAYLPHRQRPRSTAGLAKNLRQRTDGRWYWHWDPRFIDGPLNVNVDGERVVEELEDAAQRLAIPTLLVRGGASDIVSQESADAFLKLAPQSRFVDVSGASHMVAGDKNDVFAAAILDFLESAL